MKNTQKESIFKKQEIENFLKKINDEQALYFLGLTLAANDLALNVDALNKFPSPENIYFFTISISIIREVASLIKNINSSELSKTFSEISRVKIKKLESDLASFENFSLTKSTLKPVRDHTFHYNYMKSNERSKISSCLYQLREKKSLEVGLIPDTRNILAQRYLFADEFRSNFINQFLSESVVTKISTIAVDLIAFVDSITADLLMFKR
jgi:hypothetical protein